MTRSAQTKKKNFLLGTFLLDVMLDNFVKSPTESPYKWFFPGSFIAIPQTIVYTHNIATALTIVFTQFVVLQYIQLTLLN